ncbi:MAG: hypothetical protein HY877_01045 [Deltaproteobacteria bacterium]|nr:hypothetical protein [Deltaproteobacteria bacterium]
MKKRILYLLTGLLVCRLQFEFKQRTNFFKNGKGKGTITCDNNEKADVDLKIYGGWVALKSKSFQSGGTFSPVSDISMLFGSYNAPEGTTGTGGDMTPIPVVSKSGISLRFTNPSDGEALGLTPGGILRVIQQK